MRNRSPLEQKTALLTYLKDHGEIPYSRCMYALESNPRYIMNFLTEMQKQDLVLMRPNDITSSNTKYLVRITTRGVKVLQIMEKMNAMFNEKKRPMITSGYAHFDKRHTRKKILPNETY